MNEKTVTLAHGAGGKQTNELIGQIFKKYFDNDLLTADDAAVFETEKCRMAMTTDGFIVSPYKFKGGNIGKLSICGTVNDIACMGAKPLYITCAFVIEEGFEIAELEKIAEAMKKTADEVGVKIIAGDTKVAGRGQVDKVFITTTGVGRLYDNANTSGAYAKPGDKVIVTGDVGRHGCTVLVERNDFGIQADVQSDCAPLCNAVEELFKTTGDIHVIRDSTRGGVGTVLYEIAAQSNVGISLNAEAVPVADSVKGICGMLGLEPLYLACEGRLVIVVPQEKAQTVLDKLKSCKYTENSVIIGEVTDTDKGRVILETEIGTKTILPQPTGELLPRIC